MPIYDDEGSLQVHEADYGGFPFGDLIGGLFLIVVGLVGLIFSMFRRTDA